jgi:squalene monooxygenase
MPHMRDACFAYFQRGGICVDGPIRLLAGLTPNYWVLFAHFFAVALLGVGRIVGPVPLPGRVATAARVIYAATKTIAPLIASEGVTFLKYWPLRALVAPKPAAAARAVAAVPQ